MTGVYQYLYDRLGMISILTAFSQRLDVVKETSRLTCHRRRDWNGPVMISIAQLAVLMTYMRYGGGYGLMIEIKFGRRLVLKWMHGLKEEKRSDNQER